VIDAVSVVIPIHDEREGLPGCLAAVATAFAALPPSVEPLLVLVFDSCTDGSERVPIPRSRAAPTRCFRVQFRNVGQARATGMRAALAHFAGFARSRLWLATTDADSAVPTTWLTGQLHLAEEGAQAVAGTVRVADWSARPPGLGERFQSFYDEPGEVHPHVHGANLGIRGDAYEASGGFEPLVSGEDHALWRALQKAERPRVSTRQIAVMTSARCDGRAPRGFSGFLTQLARE
jgi:hypothetical protein